MADYHVATVYAREIALLQEHLARLARIVERGRARAQAEMNPLRQAEEARLLAQAEWTQRRGKIALELLSGELLQREKRFQHSCAYCLRLLEEGEENAHIV